MPRNVTVIGDIHSYRFGKTRDKPRGERYGSSQALNKRLISR